MKLEEIVKIFNERNNLALVVEDNALTINVEGGLPFTIQEIPEMECFLFLGELGYPPPCALEALLSGLLMANHLFMGTHGASISRDPDTGKFFLNRIVPCRSIEEFEDFGAVSRNFIKIMYVWHQAIEEYKPSEDGGSGENTPEKAGKELLDSYMMRV